MSAKTLARAIPAGDRLLLDTTTLAAYLDSSEAAHPVARRVLEDFVAGGRNPAVISMITVMIYLPSHFCSPTRHPKQPQACATVNYPGAFKLLEF